jgi:predicted MPP superfamily phosphohydrolase
MPSFSRRGFLLLPVLGASSAAYAKTVEPGWLEFTQRECFIQNLAQPIDLVHLSDLHASEVVPNSLIERAVETAIEVRPDFVCITGDFVTGRTGFDPIWYSAVLQRLTSHTPTFAVLGNHDGGSWSASDGGLRTTAEVTRIVEAGGVKLMANRSEKIRTPRGAELQIIGVGDMLAGDLDPNRAFRNADPQSPSLLLSHNPDSKEALGPYKWDLMLSGHTHGGQVVAPLFGLNPAPVRDRDYIAGMKPWRNRWIHISRGVGNIGGIRFNCRPEVTLIRLLPAASSI